MKKVKLLVFSITLYDISFCLEEFPNIYILFIYVFLGFLVACCQFAEVFTHFELFLDCLVQGLEFGGTGIWDDCEAGVPLE